MKPSVVIKVGGALLESDQAPLRFFAQLAQLNSVTPIIVHGGGAQVQALLQQMGIASQKHNGMRITPQSDMPIVAGVLAGSVNKQLVAHAQTQQCNAVGLSIVDGNMMQCKIENHQLGCVGTPVSVDTKLVSQLVENSWLPIISSIGSNGASQLLNINADHAAAALASALHCPLILLSDVPAVLDSNKQRIATLNAADIQTLIANHTITDGMAVKVESALDTAKATKASVTIASWQDDIQRIITGELGTQVFAE